jgi:hypothetical protein
MKGLRMARKTKDTKPKPKRSVPRRGEATEATVDEFQQEGMGIAPKE